MRETQVKFLIPEAPTCCGATALDPNCSACARGPGSSSYCAGGPREEKPPQREAHAGQLERRPRSPHLGTDPAQRGRPSTANKK